MKDICLGWMNYLSNITSTPVLILNLLTYRKNSIKNYFKDKNIRKE